MQLVQLKIQQLIKSYKIKQSAIAQKTDVNRSTISRFLSGKTEISFDSMLKIAEIFPDETTELMALYFQEIELPENIKCSLEYASINRMLKSSEFLIEKALYPLVDSLESQVLKEWGAIYQVSYQYQANVLTVEYLFENLNLYPYSFEMRILKQFFRLYFLQSQNKYELILDISNQLERSIQDISNDYMRASFQQRLYETYALAFLYCYVDLEKARQYCKIIISESQSKIYIAHAYTNLGLSYMFEDYEASLRYFIKSRESYDRIKDGAVFMYPDSNITFLKNIWNKHEAEPVTNDASELAHYYIRNGKKERGLAILEMLPHSGFRYFYRWLATEDRQHLYKAIEMFKKNKKLFFLKGLIEPELIKIGFDKEAASLFCT